MRRFSVLVATTLMLSSALEAGAQVTPTGNFALNPGATFGGSGIPGPVMYQTLAIPGNPGGPTLALGASQRYDNPPLSWNGAGDYFAEAGNDASTTPVAGYAKWNFDFYVGGANVENYRYGLFIDGNKNLNDMVHYAFFFDVASSTNAQNSWNLGMNFLAPTGFNPLNQGSYTFALVAYDKSTGGIPAANTTSTSSTPAFVDPNSYSAMEAARVAIRVNTTVPEPSTYALMASGLIALGVAARRRRAIPTLA